ncbi:BnaC03g64420D [Brassica napus]|uniref:(rape) hypothetical protein n=1 Tax=Brassica napus TaxID=3708 RepID=A0A078J1Q8_BRANA|nr:unnamed protein product [Brassica napus]CDY57061.1 BnaC03g64420D [Brassica napus]
MLFRRLSRLGFRIAKELPKERHFSVCGRRILQRSYGQYLHSSAVTQTQTRTFRQALFSNNHNLCTSFSTSSGTSGEETEKINVVFVDKDGEEIHIKVPIGMNILEAAHENDIELEGTLFFHFILSFGLFLSKYSGACECSLACSTCHVIVMDTEYYNKLEEPTDEENDMLDLAFALTETSRLGCQVIAKPEIDGIRLAIPSATRNFAVDGFVPKPH